MLKLFKNNNPAILILVPIITFLLSLKVLHSGAAYNYPVFPTFLTKQIFNLIDGQNSLIFATVINDSLLVLNTLVFLKLVNKYIFFESRNFFQGFIFLFLNGAYISPYEFLPVLIAELFFIFALIQMFEAAKKQNAVFDFFNIGLIVSIGSLFWYNLAYFSFIIFASLIVMRRIILREWITAVIGLVTPYFVFFSIDFIITGNLDLIFTITDMFTRNTSHFNFSEMYILFLGYSFLLGIISGLKILSEFNGININLREYYKIFTWVNIVALSVFFLSENENTGAMLFALLALTIPLTRFFTIKRKSIIGEVMFDLLLIMLILTQFDIQIPYIDVIK